MQRRTTALLVILLPALALAYYTIEPWAVTFLDDGPYYSTGYSGDNVNMLVQSQAELRRFGRLIYVIESHSLNWGDESVLVLRDSTGAVEWVRVLVKPDGELGSIEFRKAHLTWYGGWRISIKPGKQESGFLYLSAFGGFRFFNHGW